MKSFLVNCLFVMSAVSVEAQTAHNMILTFNESDFVFESYDGMTSINSVVYPAVFGADTSAPALPLVCLNVLLGPDDNYAGVELAVTDTLLNSDVLLQPNPDAFPTSITGYLFNPALGYDKEEYPITRIEYTGTHVLGGYRFASFLFCPFRYETASMSLFMSSRVCIAVKVTANPSSDTGPVSENSYHRNSIRSLVVNSDDLDKLYPLPTRASSTTSTILSSPLQYLIVTRDSLKDEYQKLADWKIMKGVVARVVTVEEINASYQSYTAKNIKTAIKSMFNESEGSLTYVLLGGVPSIVPTMSCKVKYEKNDSLVSEAMTPTDIYYACLTDIEWNKNGNAFLGEVADSIDVTPYVLVTRLPTMNNSDVRNMVNRIVEYEKCPKTTGWKNEMLLCGVKMFSYVSYMGSTVSDAHAKSERMYETALSNWDGSRYRFYDTGTDHASGAGYNVTRDHLQEELGKGFVFVNVMTHGEQSYWSMEGDNTWNYNYTYANSLQNPSYSFVSTLACNTNAIDNPSTSLGTSFMRNPSAGIMAYYGAARENWDTPSGYLAYGSQQLCWMYDSLFNRGMGLAQAIYSAKRNVLSACYSNSIDRWLHFTLTPLCDPEMHVYTEMPTYLGKGCMSTYHDDFYFSPNPHTVLEVCVMSRLDMGATYYERRSANDNLYFSNTPQECLVTATAPNRIAYQAIHGGLVKLQNEDLCDNIDIIASETLVGSNVASDRDQGPVTLQNGYTVISTGYGTTIYNDFEVKLGATLEISTHN